jgi:hypothetical protein
MNDKFQNMKKFLSRLWTVSLIVLLILLICFIVNAEEKKGWTKEKKVLMTNIGGIAVITGWGISKWDYFENDPSINGEGWFSKNFKEGGADKFGHFYFSYTLSHILSGTFDYWSYPLKKAALLGSFSSFAITTSIELGDSFSNFGFSYEDLIMDTIGSAVGYFLYVNPNLSNKIDFRIEFIPDLGQPDASTDYDNMKFLVVLKLDGFESTKNTWAEYIELHLGWNVRGYSDNNMTNERNISVGIGINLSKVFKNFSMKKTSKIFNYYQLPYTYINMNKGERFQ